MQTNRSKGTTKSVREGAACPCLHRYRFRVRQGVQPWTVVRLIFPRWWPSPRVPTRRNSFDNKRGGGTRIRKRCLRNLDGNVSYCGSDSKNGKTLCIVCIDTMTMRTLCRAQICLRVYVCGGGIYEKEL